MSFLVNEVNSGNDKAIVNIKISTIKTVDFKHKNPFKKEVELPVSLRNITIIDKIILSICVVNYTCLCLKD